MDVEIIIPSSPEELPLHRYQAFMMLDDDERLKFERVLSVMSGCAIEHAYRVKARDVERSLNAIIKAVSTTDSPLQYHITLQGVTYGLEPQLDEITFGNLADLSAAFESPDTWHKALAILYRPILRKTDHLGGLYAIEPHKADSDAYKRRQEVFKNAPTSIFLGVRAFFLNGSRALETFTLVSSRLHLEKLMQSSSKKLS